jgi:hypothetical protein
VYWLLGCWSRMVSIIACDPIETFRIPC